jgi:hypothetical protein
MPTLLCPGCGYDLRDLTEHRCPECGRAFDPPTLAKWHAAEPSDTRSVVRALLLAPVVITICSPAVLVWAVGFGQAVAILAGGDGALADALFAVSVFVTTAIIPASVGCYIGSRYASGRYRDPSVPGGLRVWPAWAYMVWFSALEYALTLAYTAAIVLMIAAMEWLV